MVPLHGPYQARDEMWWGAFKAFTGDVNRDGRTDLIWNALGDGNRTYVSLGQRDGTFTSIPPQDRVEQWWWSFQTFTGDVNGDGRTDLIWNATDQGNRIYVSLGRSDGGFTPLPPQDRVEQWWWSFQTFTGDVNGDGRTDLIWNATDQGNRVYLSLGNADGTFTHLLSQDFLP
jgi:hypothetical protein